MENQITSTQNSYIKLLKKLSSTKARTQMGLFLVEGEKCIAEALKINGLCEKLLILPENEAKYAYLTKGFVGDIVYVTDIVFKAISNVKTPQGVMAVCNLAHFNIEKRQGIVVALDGVSDPGNMGAIIRTADAVGASAVYTLNGSVDILSPKVIRASMGSVFHLPILKCVVADINALKVEGYCILGADLEGTTKFIVEDDKICLVIGSESHGISEEVSDVLDKKIKIPIYGQAESLNAAVAASILLYKLVGY